MMAESIKDERIIELELQVKSLTETVNAMYDALRCHGSDVPPVRVPKIVSGSDSVDLKQAVDQAVGASPQEVLQRFLKSEAPSKPISHLEKLEKYVYTALDPELSEVRVIGFQTAESADDPIQCNIYTVTFDDIGAPGLDRAKGTPKYPLATLSYTWGDATDQELIVVDGKSLPVTRNLHTALKHFRGSLEHNVLADKWRVFWWIDAICINQQDLDERKTQVGLMTRLYRSASVGHVWLGSEADDSPRAMSVLRRLGYSPKTDGERVAWEYRRKQGQRNRPMGPGVPPLTLDEEPGQISTGEKASNYDAVVKLFGRAWFSRVWIRQEFALPEAVVFHCGHDVCTWEELTKAAMLLSLFTDVWKVRGLGMGNTNTTAPLVSCFRRVEELRQLRERLIDLRKWQSAPEKTFLTMRHVLFHARDSDATDPRDKVYSMLPLTDPYETQLVADYRISYQDVYKAAALDMARTSLNFLCACQYVPGDSDLPSWVPNLLSKWRYKPTINYLEADEYYIVIDFRYTSPKYRYIPEGNIFEAEGKVSDHISLICQAVSNDMPSPTDLEFLRGAWSKFFVENTRESVMNKDLTDLSWQALEPNSSMFGGSRRRFTTHTGNHDLYTIAGTDDPYTPDPIGFDAPEVRAAQSLLPEFDLPAPVEDRSGGDLDRRRKYLAPNHLVGRKFAKTSDGTFGFVPSGAQVGDLVCHFRGSPATFILRKKSDGSGHLLVGDARESLLS